MLKRATVLLCAVLLFTVSTFSAYADDVSLNGKPKDIRVFHVAAESNFAPFSYKENDVATGRNVEIVRKVVEAMGAQAEFTLLRWDDAIHGLKNGTYDILTGVCYTDGDDSVLFTHPFGNESYVAFGKNEQKLSVNDLRKKCIALYAGGGVYESFVESFDLKSTSVVFTDAASAFSAVESGACDVVIAPYNVGKKLFEEQKYTDLCTMSDVLFSSAVCMAVSPENEELCNELNEWIDQMSSNGTIDALNDKWLTGFAEDSILKQALHTYWFAIATIAAGVILLILAVFMFFQGRMMRHLRFASQHDAMTGLFNKRCFCEKVDAFVAHNRHQGERYLVIRFDIDHFRTVNETIGIRGGDHLLSCVGRFLLQNVIGKGSVIYAAHLESDHFVLFCRADSFNAEFFCQSLNKSFHIYAPDFNVTFTFGIVSAIKSETAAVLCDLSYVALRSVKEVYGKSYAWYDSHMRKQMQKDRELDQTMEAALRAGQFVPFYQPQINYETGELIGAEALVRWIHPEKGMIPPDRFIPHFEKTGFILNMDYSIWEQVIKQLRKWNDAGVVIPHISLNVSRFDLTRSELPDMIHGLLKKYGVSANQVHFECTETAFRDDSSLLIEMADRMKAAGFILEMDDFGSGYSSLNLLKSVPIDLLKMDMKFLEEDISGNRAGLILSSVVHMSHSINLPVIAEGVETKEQADFLKSIGCLYMQGYLFSKPLPVDVFEKYVQNKKTMLSDSRFIKATDNAVDFLDATTQSTLLFNSFVGGAGIFEYTGGVLKSLRLNDQFLETVGDTRENILQAFPDILASIMPETRNDFIDMLDKAEKTGKVATCITCSVCLKGERKWFQNGARFLSRRVDGSLFYISIENITEQTKMRESIAALNSKMKTILNNMPGGIVRVHIGENGEEFDYVSTGFNKMFGYKAGQVQKLTKDNTYALVYPGDVARVSDAVMTMIHQKTVFNEQYRFRKADGEYLLCNARGAYFANAGNDKTGTVYLIYTEAQTAEKSSVQDNTANDYDNSLKLLGTVFYKIVEINLTDNSFYVIKDNLPEPKGKPEKLTEWLESVLQSPYIFQNDKQEFGSVFALDKLRSFFAEKDECFRYRYRRQTEAGIRWVSLEILRTKDYAADHQTAMLYIRDIHDNYVVESEEKKRMVYHMNHDVLTGLNNRFRYTTIVNTLEKSEKPVGIVYADLNGLKYVNDHFGHDKGDEKIIDFSLIISRIFGQNSCYRISGDEFIVLAENTDEAAFSAATEKLRDEMSKDEIAPAAYGTTWLENSSTIYSAVRFAEKIMYADKHNLYETHPELIR